MKYNLSQRKRKCQICGSRVHLVENLYNSNWRYQKRWMKCNNCSFLQSIIEPDLYSWLSNGKGGVGGKYELGYRQYKLARIMGDKFNKDKVLIHGAGYTDALKLLLDSKYNVYGCDIVESVIEKEKNNLGMNRYFHKDTYPDTKFDAIVSVEVYEHLIDPLNETKNIISHMKDDGILCVTTDFLPKGRLIKERDNYGIARGHVSYWSINSMKKLAEICDLRIHFIKLHLPDPSPDDPASMNYDYQKEYPNRLVAFMYKDKKLDNKIKSTSGVYIKTHNTKKGIELDYGEN